MPETPSSAGKLSLWDLLGGGFHLWKTKLLEKPGLFCSQGEEFQVELVQILSVLGHVQATQHIFFFFSLPSF